MKYLDKDGLSHLWEKIKAKIPTKTSQITNDSNFITNTGSTSGNAGSATKLQTARTIGIGTGATGTATSFNGTANITIPITDVKDAYVTWGGKAMTTLSPNDMGCLDEFGHNKLAFLPASKIVVEYTTDGGTTWIDYGLTNAQKVAMVTTSGPTCVIGKGTASASGGTMTNANCGNYKVRVVLTFNGSLYTICKKVLLNMTTAGANNCSVKVEARTYTDFNAGNDTWRTLGTYTVAGWSGWNSLPVSTTIGGSNTWSDAQYRFTLSIGSVNTSYPCQAGLIDFRLIGLNNWNTPSELARAGHLYNVDTDQNALFPAAILPKVNNAQVLGNSTYKWANVYATKFTGSLVGNADTATSATTASKANNVSIIDTRSVNSTPADYMSSGRRVVYEFKTRTAINSPFSSGDFCTLQTIVQWDNNSGGRPVQLAYSNGFTNIAYRVATSDSAWGTWKLIATKDDIPSLTNYYYSTTSYDSTHNSLPIVRQNSSFDVPVLDNSTYKLNIGNIPTATSITNDSNTVPRTDTVYQALNGKVNPSDLTNLEDEIYDNVYLKTEIGDFSNLDTSVTNSIVGAINCLASGEIVDSSLTGGSGYIKYSNGFMIQWKLLQVTAGGTKWTDAIYYSNHSMGNWAIPFTSIFSFCTSCSSYDFWTSLGGAGMTSAGTLRCFRPTNATQSTYVSVTAIGMWK